MVKKTTYQLSMVGLGLAVLVSGLSTWFTSFSKYPMAILLVLSGLLLLISIGWKSLLNGIDNENEIIQAIGAILAVLVIVSAILTVLNVQVPSFIASVVPWVVAIVGGYIIYEGATM